MQLGQPLWRAVIVFRLASLVYAALLMVRYFGDYAHPAGGWVVVGVMAVWTFVTSVGYAAPPRAGAGRRALRRGWPLLVADLVVAGTCLLASRWVIQPEGVALGAPTLPMAWVAGPVLAWAVAGGRRMGLVAALVMGVIDTIVRNGISVGTINGTVLMLFAGVIFGHISRLNADAEERLQRAAELEAANRERERLARGIHDSVLQVLSLVQRRGAELGGEAAELGRLAGEQEATLRTLVASADPPVRTGTDAVDLRTVLDRQASFDQHASTTVTVAVPAGPVWLPGRVAHEIGAAVRGALDNVAVHAGEGAKAWVLLEEESTHVTVTVRDNGAGFADGRLDEAREAGRLGVAHSIRGRVRDLGGTVEITSVPGRGTEVELRIPLG